MALGTITRINRSGGFGFIKADDGGPDVYFRVDWVQDTTPSGVVEGMRVEYEPRKTDRGMQTAWARAVQTTAPTSSPSTPRPEVKPAAAKTTGPYRFLNPYNFVRPLGVPQEGYAAWLERYPPPPHDRYVGLTGRITCQLTATTPLFVSDSHGVDEETVSGKIHRTYRFFQDPDKNVAIPGTSVRGAIRSVFEAVTNSCFAHFAGHKRLSYHLPPGDALRLIPARVHQVKEGAQTRWELDLMPGKTPISPNYRPSGAQYAAWVHLYQPLWASQTVPRAPNTDYAGRRKLLLGELKHKDEAWAVVQKVAHPLRRFEFWNVVALAKSREALPSPGQGQEVVQGYLCLNNQNIENKHDERLFFRHPTNKSGLKALPLDERVLRDYDALIDDYWDRHKDAIEKRSRKHNDPQAPYQPEGKDPAFSRFIRDRYRLSDGELVYAMIDQDGNDLTVRFIVPVSVPRVAYEYSVGDLLSGDALTRCTDYDHLCPACRVFGWVWEGDEADLDDPDKITAYAGRVRFSHARRVKDGGTFDATLAILSSPKPTTTRFYLRPAKGRPQDAEGLDDEAVGYDGANILRGRKVYRHHGQANRAEYTSVGGKKSDQNRSVKGVQREGTVFEFTVDFENLAPSELGALLWSLEMEGWHHRLGFGKPLGFGSATLQVTALAILDAQARYASLTSQMMDALDRKAEWVTRFKADMAKGYGVKSFDNLSAVVDLRALLAETPPLPVHYPRPAREPLPDGKNFEWFVGNKRSGKDSGPRLVLHLADEDREGLPLIDKYGDEIR